MSLPINQQKIAERLKILHDHALGITARIYNIKKACGDPKSKPAFLSDRSLEAGLKYIVKKFPTTDTRGGGAAMQQIHSIRAEILKSLQLYYFTFVDLLELRDQINELLTTIDACQLQLDITLNTDLTYFYLDLISTYVSLMILLSRVDDRKAVLGLYNAAYEMQHQSCEQSFPRLGQLILDYDPPLRKLSEEFIPHQKILFSALASLTTVYHRRNLTANEWRSAELLSLTASPQKMLAPAQTETIACEYLSLELMDRWIIFGLLVCHQTLSQNVVSQLWQRALQTSLTTPLFRDEVLPTHSYIQQFFESIKGYNKRVSEVKDLYNAAVQNACHLHRERRKFLRSALRELSFLLADQPGLLGPKALFVWMALSLARDEVLWLVRHVEHWPLQGNKAKVPEDLTDRQLPELLFFMEELRGLVEKYTQVIQRYFVQFLCVYDAIALNEMIQALSSCPEEESMILSAMCNSIANLSVEFAPDETPAYDFRALRLDWCRLQAYMSCGRSGLSLAEHRNLAYQVNRLVFRTKMVDYLDQMLVETSDLSIFCFHSVLFEKFFNICLELPAQARYLPAFPLICSHFPNALHSLCPEERQHIGERSLTLCNLFLDDIAKEAKNVLTNIAEQHCLMNDKLLPKNCARLLAETLEQQRKNEKRSAKMGTQPAKPAIALPGEESYRRSREDISTLDKLHMALTELCYAVNYAPTIVVWEHTFASREYLTQHLESRFNKTVKGMVMYNPEKQEIAKPSELLSSIRAFMRVLQTVENYVHIDITRVFNGVLLQQTQPQDSNGEDSITTQYTKWYLEVMLRRVSSSQILSSSHQIAFIQHPTPEGTLHFNPQEYTDFLELKALCELLGPYGIKFLCERLTWHVASQINELKKLVIQNLDVLRAMRSNFDKPDRMKELYKDLVGSGTGSAKNTDSTESFIQRLIIVGEILGFRDLLMQSLRDLLSDRCPFLMASVVDFESSFPDDHPEFLTAYEMLHSTGIRCPVDPTLVNALKAQKGDGSETSEEDYHISCLLMVFIAVCLPKLASHAQSFHRASIAAHLNNAHCIPKAINEIAGALFALHGRSDTIERMKEFLALASGSLLRLGQEPIDRSSQPNIESTYILLDKLVENSPWLPVDLLESCFPYVLLRSAYHCVYKQEEWQRS